MRWLSLLSLPAAALITAASFAGPTEYTIVDLGIIDPGDAGSQGISCSPGGAATGRTLGVSNQGFSWTAGGGRIDLMPLASRPFASANGANDAGIVVGTAATTFFGSSPLPVIWDGVTVSLLPLPLGETLGRANDVNASNVAVGSVDGGSVEEAAMYSGATATKITTLAIDGSMMRTALAINDDGLVVGNGIDPNNASRNVGLVYDSDMDTMVEVGALPGRNGALAFAVSNAGHVVGSSMMNQGSGTPYIWTEAGGIVEIPLPSGTGQGSARGVNSDGWAVGTASNAFAIPFLYDGSKTVPVADLLPAGSGWDLSMNTSSSALGISDDGIIIGSGEFNGEVRGYALIPVLTNCPEDLDGNDSVGFADLSQLLGVWGSCPGCPEDLDGNGSVGFADLTQLVGNWGQCD